ncbi:MAG TPA: peptidoglycan DD-metalloendopeptidase family protein [Anaeromyxobacter sp.]|nr:peptidoglycan DD-metalloendopeptidase family protein [Anaeromyxobacter sp.]
MTAWLVLGALVPLSLLAPDARGRLDALEERRRAEETAARLLAEQERSVLDILADSERALLEAVGEARRAEAARALSEAALSRAREEETSAIEAERERLALLRPRLFARARLGRTGELELFLSSGSLKDLVKRRYLLEHILRNDLRLLSEAQAARAAREEARATRQEEAERLASLAAEAALRRDEAKARREEREALLLALQSAKSLHERAAAEAGEQARKLADFVATLPPPRTSNPGRAGFAALKGGLPPPAPGPITAGFGRLVNPRFNTVTMQNGLDIGAPAGTSVRAVAPGRVVHAGWFKGYGNLIIVDHGEGYHSLVAHLGSMQTATGEEVEAGSVLGTVGDSGSLKGPYLYFEIREHGRPVDPQPWLREGGER